jgi:hypothetical protein
MSREKLLEKGRERRRKIITLFGEKVICLVHPIGKIEEILKGGFDGDKTVEFVAEQFLDPDDGKPVFSADYLRNELGNSDLQELIRLFFKNNGADGGVDGGTAEKN